MSNFLRMTKTDFYMTSVSTPASPTQVVFKSDYPFLLVGCYTVVNGVIGNDMSLGQAASNNFDFSKSLHGLPFFDSLIDYNEMAYPAGTYTMLFQNTSFPAGTYARVICLKIMD